MTKTLPKRQAQILALLKARRSTGDPVPSIREMGDVLGLSSTSTIHWHLTGLADRGLIYWEPGTNRAIRVVDPETPDTLELIRRAVEAERDACVLILAEIGRLRTFGPEAYAALALAKRMIQARTKFRVEGSIG